MSRTIFLFLLSVAMIFLLSCDFDHGLGPSKTKITGAVIFDDRVPRPPDVEEVRVVITAKTLSEIFKGEVGLADVYFSTAVNFGKDTAAYEISTPVGTYPLLGVLWKKRGVDWEVNKLIGIYNANCDTTFAPLSVQLTKAQPVTDSVNICAFWPRN